MKSYTIEMTVTSCCVLVALGDDAAHGFNVGPYLASTRAEIDALIELIDDLKLSPNSEASDSQQLMDALTPQFDKWKIFIKENIEHLLSNESSGVFKTNLLLDHVSMMFEMNFGTQPVAASGQGEVKPHLH